jgi:large subunit ribosomal protein L20
MARVKTGPKRKNKHKKILKGAKGHYGRRKNTIRIGRQSAEKAGQYAYAHRRLKKRDFRSPCGSSVSTLRCACTA